MANLCKPSLKYPWLAKATQTGKQRNLVQDVKDQLRTMKLAFEDRFQMHLASTSPVMLWLIDHVTNTLNRLTMGSDGRTPSSWVCGGQEED